MQHPREPRTTSKFLALAAALHVALVPVAVAAAGAAPAAATPAERDQATAKFLKGKELFTAKKYAEALAQFQASYDVVASPNARLFVARAYRELGKPVEAWQEFGKAATEANVLAPTDAKYAKTAEAAFGERKELEAKIAFVALAIQGPTDATKVTIAGADVPRAAWGEPVPLLPGSVEISVETPSVPAARRMVTLAAGEKGTVQVDATTGVSSGAGSLIGPPVVPPAPAPAAPTPVAPAPTSRLRTWSYAAGGVGVVGLAAFGVLGALTAGKYAALKDECANKPCPESKRDDVESGKTTQTLANVALGVAIVGVATGVTLFVLSKPKKPSDVAASAVIGPSYVGLQGTF